MKDGESEGAKERKTSHFEADGHPLRSLLSVDEAAVCVG